MSYNLFRLEDLLMEYCEHPESEGIFHQLYANDFEFVEDEWF